MAEGSERQEILGIHLVAKGDDHDSTILWIDHKGGLHILANRDTIVESDGHHLSRKLVFLDVASLEIPLVCAVNSYLCGKSDSTDTARFTLNA